MCAFAAALLSCTTEEVAPEVTLDYASGQNAEVTVSPNGGEIILAFVSSEDWLALTVENWFEFEKNSGKAGNNKIAVKVDPNITGNRTGIIRIEAGEKTLPFTITQDVSDHVSAFEKEFEIDANGGSATLSFTTTNVWTATTEAEWLTLSATEGEPGRTAVTATAGQNTEGARTATVIVTCGEEKVEFTIFQDACPPVLLTYEDWIGVWESVGADNNTISYTVRQKTPGQSYTVSGFDATVEAWFDAETGNLLLPFQEAGGNSSYDFYLAGVDTNNYVAYGDNDEGILAIVTSKDGNTAQASGNEYDYTYSDGSIEHVLLSWIGLMGYGRRSDGSTGWVTFSDVEYLYLPADWTKTGDVGGEEPPVPGNHDYTDWLGEWSVTRQKCAYNAATGKWEYQADKADTWTISQKVSGVSYTITGMNGEEFPVEALYTSDGSLSITNGQEVGSAMFSGFDHPFNISLLATYLNDEDGGAYRISGSFEICHASLTSATEANLVPNTINVGNLGNIALSAPRFYATDPASNTVYSFDSNIMTIVPTKMTKIGGNGGGGNTGGYDSFLGTWSWYSEEDGKGYTFNVSEDVKNSSYLVKGFGDDLTTYYNNDKMEFCFDIVDMDDEYYYLFAGEDQDGYVEFGDEENDDLLATATVSGSTMTLQGHSYTASYGYEEICSIGMYALTLDQQKIYGFNGVPYVTLPGQWTGTGTASARTLSMKTPQVNKVVSFKHARKLTDLKSISKVQPATFVATAKAAPVKTSAVRVKFVKTRPVQVWRNE